MNQILFPTDWNKASLNAFEYAYKYAITKGCGVIILNAYQVDLHDQKLGLNDKAKVNAYKLQCEKRDAFFESVRNINPDFNDKGEVVFETRILEGDPTTLICKATEPMPIELVVMGTDGAKESKNGLRGTITRSVIEKAHCPVLAVPPGTIQFPPHKVLGAIDFKNDERKAISALMSFADIFNASATFLYISSNQKSDAEEQLFRDHYKTTQYYLSNLENWKIDIISGENVIEELNEYISKNNFDLLALETRSHKEEGNTKYNSITKQMSLQTEIPLFALHSIQ